MIFLGEEFEIQHSIRKYGIVVFLSNFIQPIVILAASLLKFVIERGNLGHVGGRRGNKNSLCEGLVSKRLKGMLQFSRDLCA